MDPAPTATVTKRARKPRAPKPVVEKKPRAPVTTLLSRIRAMGPHHEAAYRVLKNDTLDEALRNEFSHTERKEKAKDRLDRAVEAGNRALADYQSIAAEKWADGDAGKTLDALARQIAEAKGETIADDTKGDGPSL